MYLYTAIYIWIYTYVVVLLKFLFPKKTLPEFAQTGEADRSTY